MLKVGTFIQNRYEIISRIGTGGMADVYKAKDHKLNRFVAVKVLKKEFREDKVFISKFNAEAQSAAGLAHANIVNVYDVGEEAGINYIVMELVEGITLKEYINNKGRLTVREATSIALQISAGLEAAHNNGIIHRDVKPQNIIISTDGKVKVADFGIARAASTNTINSGVMGSVHYSSPEQARGGYSDEKSDIYSLGITMYEMLTGRVPFDGDTAVAVALRHLQEDIRGPKELVPDIPESTNRIVMKCTQKSPDRRYSNMSELIRDMRESLVNPSGDFVTIRTTDNTSQTIIMSKEEVEQINAEQRAMPVYDESFDVGAAAGLHDQEPGVQKNRAYQPGSYYQKSQYQGVASERSDAGYDADRWNADYNNENGERGSYDPYFDEYDDPDDYAIHRGKREPDYRLEESFVPKKEPRRQEEDDDVGLNPKLEKVVTVGGIIVAVIIGCVFLSLLANAFGLLNFGRHNTKKNKTEKTTEATTEQDTERMSGQAQQVAVPTILAKTEKEALEQLAAFGLKGKKLEETSQANGYKPGQVCMQKPEGGEMADRDSTVEYKIVAAEASFELKDLKNIEQSQAQAFLLTQGLQCQVDTSQYSDTVESGFVISTNPAAGSTVKAGDIITLYISQGKQTEPQPQQPVSYVTLWNLYGYTKERAEEALNMLDLVPEYAYEASSTVAAGLVITQSASPEEEIPRGSTVILTISTGPDTSGTTAQQPAEEPVQIQDQNGIWKCNASLAEPVGYNGQSVRITLEQSGVESTIYEGSVTFPYDLQVQGASGETSGTAYIYLIDDETGEVESKIEYPGIAFVQVNG